MTKEELAKLLDVPQWASDNLYWGDINSNTLIKVVNDQAKEVERLKAQLVEAKEFLKNQAR